MIRYMLIFLVFGSCTLVYSAPVQIVRLPDGAIQPRVEVDQKGTIHMIYFKGEPMGGDLFYVRQTPMDSTFSDPILVNSMSSSIIATGTVRGAHLALGRKERVHVAWMGSPVANGNSHEKLPMFYTRLDEARTGFEPQRNVIQHAFGLDGGGSVAADTLGHVCVAWHAGENEASRKVWIARSDTDGETFASEKPAWDQETGACGCCGMRAFAEPSGSVYLMYRSATESVHRDMYVLKSTDYANTFEGVNAHGWEVKGFPMSTTVMSAGKTNTWAAWESSGEVYVSSIENPDRLNPLKPGGQGTRNKHPAFVQNAKGEGLLAWSIGSGWQKPGTLAYQFFDQSGQPVGEPALGDTIPVWSRPAVAARADRHFIIVY